MDTSTEKLMDQPPREVRFSALSGCLISIIRIAAVLFCFITLRIFCGDYLTGYNLLHHGRLVNAVVVNKFHTHGRSGTTAYLTVVLPNSGPPGWGVSADVLVSEDEYSAAHYKKPVTVTVYGQGDSAVYNYGVATQADFNLVAFRDIGMGGTLFILFLWGWLYLELWFRSQLLLLRDGLLKTATVVLVTSIVRKGNRRRGVSYSFDVDGRPYRGTVERDEDRIPELQVGDAYNILYIPRSPRTNIPAHVILSDRLVKFVQRF